ncbi:2254_t:CDS:1 [Racocetra fulgida]|uniref:2254_t:CDS:1 n=1 Tax=Racocetra fulgida TaxID=60492 RepID=A0A9N9B0J6_9GLOM|nr:2254_t:CDS:1 [Racocetra fulgida]
MPPRHHYWKMKPPKLPIFKYRESIEKVVYNKISKADKIKVSDDKFFVVERGQVAVFERSKSHKAVSCELKKKRSHKEFNKNPSPQDNTIINLSQDDDVIIVNSPQDEINKNPLHNIIIIDLS